MICARWINANTGRMEYINYGTAFAISPFLLMTCAHNIYNSGEKSNANEIIFVANHNGYILDHTHKISSKEGKYY